MSTTMLLAATAVAEYFNVDPDKIKQGLGYDESIRPTRSHQYQWEKCTLVLVKIL